MSDYTIYTIKLVTKDNDKYGIKEITEQQDDMPAKSYKIENDNDIDIIINSESKNFNEILDEFMKKSKSICTNEVTGDIKENGEEKVNIEEPMEDKILAARLDTEAVEEAEEKTVEEPVEQTVEEPVEQTEKAEEKAVEQTEEPVEKVVEEPIEKAVEEAVEEPVEEKAEEPVEEKAEETRKPEYTSLPNKQVTEKQSRANLANILTSNNPDELRKKLKTTDISEELKKRLLGGNKSKYSKKNTVTKKNKSFKNKRSKK